jgi:hypothetical protein
MTLFISVFTLERFPLGVNRRRVRVGGGYQAQSVYFIVVKVWAYDPTVLQIHLAPRTPKDEKCVLVNRMF